MGVPNLKSKGYSRCTLTDCYTGLFIKHSSVVERGHQLAEGRSSFDSSERMVLVNPHK
ncbi:hypothetical protein HWC16_gp170 [Salmonella phage Sepoy]|uniref:Uncharacterized protein n=2 Tax=Epseptimavirus TaxID=2732017 RepID=A0A5J6TCK7_9CAUD|nr:hypothetical protein HWC16_gp170 [Salmonella phage Sepoy]QCQ65572.1 hypothetical protein Sepoy_096 [Salmonella phage Sepoy]QFG07437.1 hypothetical protein [Salmonella phage vB_SenS_SB10]